MSRLNEGIGYWLTCLGILALGIIIGVLLLAAFGAEAQWQEPAAPGAPWGDDSAAFLTGSTELPPDPPGPFINTHSKFHRSFTP